MAGRLDHIFFDDALHLLHAGDIGETDVGPFQQPPRLATGGRSFRADRRRGGGANLGFQPFGQIEEPFGILDIGFGNGASRDVGEAEAIPGSFDAMAKGLLELAGADSLFGGPFVAQLLFQ
ncbi:MAG: hypothetical protein INF89_15660 [Roseomonas sp.]|nr:hypothetical protein [Roseomonas sp.]